MRPGSPACLTRDLRPGPLRGSSAPPVDARTLPRQCSPGARGAAVTGAFSQAEYASEEEEESEVPDELDNCLLDGCNPPSPGAAPGGGRLSAGRRQQPDVSG